MDNNIVNQQIEPIISTEPKSFYRKTKHIVVVLLVLILLLCIGVFAIYTNKNFVKNENPILPSLIPEQPTIKPTSNVSQTSLIGKWRIMSVVKNGIAIVNEKSPATVLTNGVQVVVPGAQATIEFFKDGKYQALGGCNEMMISTYEIDSDKKLSFRSGGSQRICEKQIVEFLDLNKVYAYGYEDNFLLLHYKTQNGLEGFFKLLKVKSDHFVDSTSDWKTYTDTKDNYSFKYPGDWKLFIKQSLPLIYNLSYLNKTDNKNWVIEIRLIPQDRLDLMSVTYCGAHPEDSKRCEIISVSNANGIIDWGPGTNKEYTATAEIPYVDKGGISLTLTPITLETKKILYQILSTFKFLDQDFTASWRTYPSKKAGFLIKYPSSWYEEPLQIESSSYPLHGLVSLFPNKTNTVSGEIHISYWDNPNRLSLEEMENMYKGEAGGPDIYFPGGKMITLSGVTAYQRDGVACAPMMCDRIAILANDKIIEIKSLYAATATNINKNIFDQILSTFRFLDQIQDSSPQSLCEVIAGGNWLTEYNECVGITLDECSLLNGRYDKCASACRHDPRYPNVGCTKQCVPVCLVKSP